MELVTRATKMEHKRDPREVMMEEFEASLSKWGYIVKDPTLVGIERLQPLASQAGIRVFGPDYLLMHYDKADKKTSGGIIVPGNYVEDKVQGKIAMVCGIGPLCRGDEYLDWFGDNPPKLGDWVMTSIRDGQHFVCGGKNMKLIEWKYLRLSTVDPDLVV